MPAKKKSKGHKLARMSDEERIRYLQHRAELELEAKRRKQQLIAIFTKNKLKREEAFSRLNTAKINEHWRFILRQIKCKELYDDVEYQWKNFDRLMKVKSGIIQHLYSELEVADVDHRLLQEAHIDIMDSLIGKHKQKLVFLHYLYTCEMDDIRSTDMVELNQLKHSMEQDCKHVQRVIHRQGKILNSKISTMQTQNAVNVHSITYLEEDMTSHLIHQSSIQMESLWEQLNEVITDYEELTESKRKQYEYLKEQDDAHQVEVAQYPKLHSQLQNSIETLKQDIQKLSQKRNNRIMQLQCKTKQMKENIECIRQDFAITQIVDSVQLKKLTVVSNNVLKDLKKIADRGAALLQFIKMCSNLEPLLLHLKKYYLQDTESVESSRFVSEPFDKLDNFWEHFNHIKAENILLKKEIDKLTLENKQLRHTLRTYLISVSGALAPRPLTLIFA